MAATARVSDLLRAQAEAAPDRAALAVHGGPTLTYAEWKLAAEAIAGGLVGRGIAPGERLGLFFDNAWWIDYAACYAGALLAGAVAVPLSPRFSPSELERVAEHAGISLLVRPEALAELTPPLGPQAGPDQLRAGPAAPEPQVDGAEDELAEIIYTSGTTGTPKGVACSHASILAHDLPPAPPGEASFLHAFPLGTNAGQECLRMPLRRLTTAVVLPSFDPDQLCKAVQERRIRRLQLVPAMARLLVDHPAAHRYDLSSVDRVTLSSAPAPPRLWRQLAELFEGAELFNAYALTEGGGARTLTRYDPTRPRSVGRPVGETELRVVDDAGRDVAVGEPGEVWLRRPGAPRRESFRDSDATAAAFEGDWLRTGDLGFLDGDGYLHLVDRRSDVINTGGLMVSSIEVENMLCEHPAVLEAAVVGLPHEVLGEDVAAAVVLGGAATPRDLQAFVRGRLGEHKVPHRLMVVDSLPRNPSGKVLKRELRRRLGQMAATGSRRTPRDGTEAAVLSVFQQVLALGEIGLEDDFFALGGHSLAATQAASKLREHFGIELAPTAVFDHPTVAELAALIAAAPAAASTS